MNAVMNPALITANEVPSFSRSPEPISRILAPITGTRTIRNENLAISDFLFPSIIPVAIVAPDLDIAGRTAKEPRPDSRSPANGVIQQRSDYRRSSAAMTSSASGCPGSS